MVVGVSNGWAVAGLLAAVGIALIGCILLLVWAVIALVERSTQRFRKLAAAGLALSVLGVATYWLGTTTWASNPAEDELGQIVAGLQAAGATTICGDGDAGIGPDNFEPWAKEYLRVPADTATEADLVAAAAEAGYRVRTTPTGDDDTMDGPTATQSLDGSSTGWDLSIRVWDGGTAIYCGSPYGRTESPAPGQVIMAVEVSAPSR